MQRIDQHSPEGKALQATIKRKLSDFLGAGYNDEVRADDTAPQDASSQCACVIHCLSQSTGRCHSCVRHQALHARRCDVMTGQHPYQISQVLPLYIVVMLAHGTTEPVVVENLEAFLGEHSQAFTTWWAMIANAISTPADVPAVDRLYAWLAATLLHVS